VGKLGEQVGVGLVAGPEDFERLRVKIRTGVMARLWERFEAETGKPDEEMYLGHQAADLAFVAAITKREDLVGPALERLLRVIHLPHWVHPEAGCIGLAGAGYTRQICLALDWLWPVLPQATREALLEAAIAKGVENLTPAPDGITQPDDRGQLLLARRMDVDDPYCLHPLTPQANNWDLWLSIGMIMAAALAERIHLNPDSGEAPPAWGKLHDVGYAIDRARVDRWKGLGRERMTTTIANQLGPDGDFGEGSQYASYGTLALTELLAVFQRVWGEDHWPEALVHLPRWVRNQFPAELAYGKANHNDAKIHYDPRPTILAYLATRTGDPETQGYLMESLESSQHLPNVMLLLGLDQDLPAKPMTLPDATCYRKTGQVVWRTSQDRDGVFLHLISGEHGGAHQHRDRNTFFLSAYGEHLIVDSGDSRYIPVPADPNHELTIAHNCVLPDGRGQVGSNSDPRAGRILEHEHDDTVSTLLADAGDCYEGIASCRRRVVFVRPEVFVMSDVVEGDCTTLTWLAQGYNADGKAAWQFRDREAVLTRPEARLHLFFVEPVAAFRTALGTLDSEHRHILRLEVDVSGPCLTTVLVPARPDDPDPALDRADNKTLCLSFRDREHTLALAPEAITVNGTAFPR